jgi:hypothetical protein
LNKINNLAIRLPLALAAATMLAGCYTVLRHPRTDLTEDPHASYQDCASCHSQGFAEPLYGNPYAYGGEVWWGYYGCPWWIEDCGAAFATGGGDGTAAEGRSTGGLGIPVGSGANAPPMVMPGGGAGGIAPTAGADRAPTPTSNKKIKKPRDNGAKDQGSQPEKKDKDRDDPAEDDPEGDPP